MVTLKELEQAHKEWMIAQQEFNLAEPEFVEDATHRLTAAELKYNTLLRLAKQEGVQAEAILKEDGNGTKNKTSYSR